MQRVKKTVFNALIIFSLCWLGIFSGCAGSSSGKADLARNSQVVSTNPEGKTYFTKVNIWFEKPEHIYSTNYHVGAILPVGTKVIIQFTVGGIIGYGNAKIRFTDEGAKTSYTLVYVPKHGTMNAEEFFDRYFSEGNVTAEGGELYKFTQEEQDNIKKGTIAEGMCREAVLMAYGYPPKHRTPDLSNNSWTYWKNRFDTLVLTFKDNKVQAIKD